MKQQELRERHAPPKSHLRASRRTGGSVSLARDLRAVASGPSQQIILTSPPGGGTCYVLVYGDETTVVEFLATNGAVQSPD